MCFCRVPPIWLALFSSSKRYSHVAHARVNTMPVLGNSANLSSITVGIAIHNEQMDTLSLSLYLFYEGFPLKYCETFEGEYHVLSCLYYVRISLKIFNTHVYRQFYRILRR